MRSGHIATLGTQIEIVLSENQALLRSGHIATLGTHICRAYAARYGTARSNAYLAYPYLSGGGVCRSPGILARLEVGADLIGPVG